MYKEDRQEMALDRMFFSHIVTSHNSSALHCVVHIRYVTVIFRPVSLVQKHDVNTVLNGNNLFS
jgi:hypothetical protein